MLWSFVLTCIFWAVSMWLSPDLVGQLLSPWTQNYLVQMIRLVPFVTTLGLAVVFRVAEPNIESWILLITATALTTGFGFFVVLVGGILLGWP